MWSAWASRRLSSGFLKRKSVDQTEFQRALQKFNKRKQKQAEQALRELEAPAPKAISPSLPWVEKIDQPKKEKTVESPRPRPKNIAIHVSGPVEFSFEIDWSGTMLGGQMHEQALRALFAKYLSPMGRIK